MDSIDDRVRGRLRLWFDTNPRIAQTQVGAAAGHGQPWVSNYLAGVKEKTPTLDELHAMAGVFGHSLNELLDAKVGKDEMELLDAYRAIPAAERAFARQTMWRFAPRVPARKPRRSQSGG